VTWSQLGKQFTQLLHQWVPRETNAQLSLSRLAVCGRCGTLGSAISIHETWTALLQVTSPAPGGFATQGSSAQVVPGIPVLVHWAVIAV